MIAKNRLEKMEKQLNVIRLNLSRVQYQRAATQWERNFTHLVGSSTVEEIRHLSANYPRDLQSNNLIIDDYWSCTGGPAMTVNLKRNLDDTVATVFNM